MENNLEEELEKSIKNWLAGAGMAAIMGASATANAGSGHMHNLVNDAFKDANVQGVTATSTFKPHSEGSKHGSGSYHVKVGPYNIKADHSSLGSGNFNHKQIITVNKDASDEDKTKWESTARMVHGKLKATNGNNTVGGKAMQKSESVEFNSLGQWNIK